MELRKFAETYSKLEDKALDIIQVYGMTGYGLDSIDIEDYDGDLTFVIKASISYCGSSDSEWLTFYLEEMNNDIEYFKRKRQKEIEEEKIEKEKQREKLRLQEEIRDRAKYEELKLRFDKKHIDKLNK